MKVQFKYLLLFVAVTASAVILTSFFRGPRLPAKSYSFPYQKAGLTERQAAAHLLNRFTYGATPGQIDAVVNTGLEKWFQQQLEAKQPDPALDSMLAQYKDLTLTNEQIVAEYPKNGQLVRMAVKEGIISKDSVNTLKADKKEYRDQIKAYMDKNGLKPQQELLRQFVNSKIYRAAYTNNQLQEVLTDFWFNHFNVSFTKNDCAEFIPVYERDAIRPNVLGKFDKLLLATAKSPAMLYFLDNFSSVGANTRQPNAKREQFIQQQQQQMMEANPNSPQAKFIANAQKAKKAQGLNENYAREVMELHTLGVDGGYTQSDVTQAAKVLTGWTIFPMNDGYGNAARKIVDTYGTANMEKNGFVRDGDFLFNANKHDEGQKVVLGHTFPAGGGYQEGVDLLEMLAHNPSTAKFITKKIAVRFVNDNPSQSLLDKMAKSFTDHDGDIKEVLITMATSPEFWNAQALREKTKSPFELAISSVRALNAHITAPYPLYLWITKMGQKLYYYQAPTGFPDKGQYWINTGALLNRMNFGLALATKRIPGIAFDLKALNNNHEPESAQDGLVTYGKLIMPERNLDQTIARLTPMLNDPDLGKKIDDAAGKTPSAQATSMEATQDPMMDAKVDDAKNYKSKLNKGGGAAGDRLMYAMQNSPGQNTMLSQVVGILIGSPEYQRR